MTVSKGLVIISEGSVSSIELWDGDGKEILSEVQKLVFLIGIVEKAKRELEEREQKKHIPTADTVYILPPETLE